MTTHNTEQNHSDVDASVVEHQPVSDTTADAPTSEAAALETDPQATSTASDAPATPDVATSEETPAATAEESRSGDLQEQEGSANTPSSEPATQTEFATEAAGSQEPIASTPTEEEATSSPASESEVRSFTDFIEEFRQAELQSTRQENGAETFAIFSLPNQEPGAEENIVEAVAEQLEQPSTSEAGSQEEAQSTAEEIAPTAIVEEQTADSTPDEVIEEVVAFEPIVSEDEPVPTGAQPMIEEVVSLEIAVVAEETVAQEPTIEQKPEEPVTASASAESTEKEAPIKEAPVKETPAEPPVSPLLRPATRSRVSRHSRHQREAQIAAAAAEAAQESAKAQAAAAPPVQPAAPEPVVETPAEPPRPARRYRFDRPAATTNGSQTSPANPPAPINTTHASTAPSAAPLQPEESKEKSVAAVRPLTQESEQQVKPAVNGSVQPSPAVQETVENNGASSEQGRRRQGQERQKEQIVVAQPNVNETAQQQAPAPVADVAPEDLPPLEYADLQKASGRRRRRHRSTSASNGTAAAASIPAAQPAPLPPPPVAPVAPVASVAPPVAPPAAPAAKRLDASSPAANGYSIVSGYTVNQMNMGNDASGPFMGPEPSPARGSVLTRDGRTARAEVQRAPAYPAPTRENGGASIASMNHFANVVSQAIQLQTDRMVAELRRQMQAPTNVTVSLPPFPSTERVGVFVDVANLLYSARTLRISIDFGKLLDFLRGNRRLIRAHAYCPTSPQAGDEQMFLQAVKGLGYRITTKNYKTFSSGAKKADLDLDLCMDVVRLVEGKAVDSIVLVSGDSDFMPMLDYCSDHGVRVEVAAFDEAMSATLRQSCDLFINLSMLEEIRS